MRITTQYMFQHIRRVVALLLWLFVCTPQLTAANDFGYTDEHPLTIVGDWDFRPFEFINAEGQPTGYNVDVLNLILDQLNIPHQFVMEEWHVATDIFKKRKADLIHALYFFYKDQPYFSTHKYINYYNLKVARLADTPPLNRISDLKPNEKLMVKEDDYAAIALNDMETVKPNMEYHSPKDGLTGISQGRYRYFIWGEIPLKYKIQELGLDDIQLDKIDIPAGELRIIGYNKELINIIDDQYTRLEQAGELQKIYDKWFHPERGHDDTSPMALLIIVGLLLATIIVFLLIWFTRRRVAKAISERSDLGQMMDQVLNMGDYFVVEWDFQTNMLRNKYRNLLPDGGMSPQEFLRRMPTEQAKTLHDLNTELATGAINQFDINIRYNMGTDEAPVWKDYYGNATIERANGRPRYIVYSGKDITAEVMENRHVKNIASKYKKMFETNLIAMTFYDANGKLLDINQKMREICQIDKESESYFRDTSLFDFPNIKGIYQPGTRDILHACYHFHEPQFKIDKYIEFRIRPVTDEDDRLVYYIVTNRDISAERSIYMEQREHDRKLHATNEVVKSYERQLGYLLNENQMFIWSYRPDDNVISLTRTPGQEDFSESIEEYLESVNASTRQQALAELQTAMNEGRPYNTILPFHHTPLDDTPTWYSISGIPIFDKEHKLTEYFGLSRNITSLMQAQERLRVETARAEDSGRLKAAFLANMTHEIRTPLNSIVGFSDLLPMIDDKNEKKELMRIIRNNCDMLLRLINDILEASDIESRPLAIVPSDFDFSQAFDDICQTLEQRVQGTDIQFIKDNPYKSFLTHLDKGRIQQVITNFVTNAVKYTQKGHIRVGYRTMNSSELTSFTSRPTPPTAKDGLYIYCEDTGAGIPKEKQNVVFERFVKLNEFVQGTGLGLSICKSIAERCGGVIGVSSEGEGCGSTFWIWIPCTRQENNN